METSLLEAARQRMRAALAAGESTEQHRLSIERLEAEQRQRDEVSVGECERQEQQRREAIDARTEIVLEQSGRRLGARLSVLPCSPELA